MDASMEVAAFSPRVDVEAPKQQVLDASRASVDLFIRHRSADFSIKQLADNAGISERTFYRYFPRKEDALRPFLRAGLERVVAAFRARPADEPWYEALEAVWLASWPVTDPSRSRVLHRILDEVDSLRAMLLQAVVDSEIRWSQAIAERLRLAPDSPQAMLAGAVTVAAFRLAWRRFATDPRIDPAKAVASHLRMLRSMSFMSAAEAEISDSPQPTISPIGQSTTTGAKP